ncbi:HEPN domain-containing protein [Synechococcus sp. Cruz-9H2]|uniref:HEPN domain-containing protein n=1 Tax=unclassified Synechococcus TaxID=2626047 RepID=UPI0020CBC896|nr:MULTISPECIES: HEPN domain-containing protein [unclassified Synechococcus]MCP9819393.1 HEPN domain-containing protein [Synechococcus sp. Cruz-9H2]MCP9843186.1 HEPN domain-containing protein [Synechococcus sp. Edmonson 11F2]MCP9854931.1 HEPN domain-containing protein [Synechococcus sp. Cruz-9C9]MCP9862598.1 HEPN domain-containing protein [Synechococcus sp. Cruz-7E5]MCP9870303.1 HEPN domain-containing protein [Synechococcus sp. Cruz-7B9]
MVLSEPQGLLRIASADLETAEASSDPAVFREGAWGFWLQQAVEKALKAWYLQLGGDPPLTHDLRRLLLLLEAEGVATAKLQPLAQLTVYAVQFRYDADPTPLGLDREDFNRQVKELIARVQPLVMPGSDAEA